MAEPLDVAIIGAGIAGLIHLHYARRAGLSAWVLEKSPVVGGLWARLPAWQDIQISLADWTAGDIALEGPKQPQVLANIASWVARFELADGIRLDCPVQRARHEGACWELQTPQGTVRARHLVAATGGHNTPWMPAVPRGGDVATRPRELHSSALRDPTELAGRDVLVVGGGASAFDLLDLCLEHGARHIHWAHRGLRWFTPTHKPKAVAGSVRPFAKMQASGMTTAQQNAAIGADLLGRYQKFGLQTIVPEQPFDVRTDQLFPGRARVLQQLAQLDRHHASVQAIDGGGVQLTDGSRVKVELLLWGTGYRTDLAYFDDPRLAAISSVAELASRCACIFRSLDAPDLYFPGVGLDGIGATSWSYAMGARTIMSHIRGTARLDMAPHAHRLNHLDMARHLAERDPGSFGEEGWERCRAMALETADDQPYPLPG